MRVTGRTACLLNQGWTVTHVGGWAPEGVFGVTIPATVPGSTHTDLLGAGLIVDPFLGENECSLKWMWHAAWRYHLEFDGAQLGDHEFAELVFEGLDTIATIELNGCEVARTRNMHRCYRFDVTTLLLAGKNVLTVTFSSALDYARKIQEEIGFRPSPYPHPYHAIRKMACSFGWDWGPDLQTAGVWKDVRLERWSTARFDAVRPVVRVEQSTKIGVVEVHVTLARASDVPLTLTANVAGASAITEIAAGQRDVVLAVNACEVELWWPQGYGEANLYELTVDLHGAGEHLDHFQRRVGFRTIELDTKQEGEGAGFTFAVNGQPIFVKGANWIPDDHLMTRITKSRLRRRIQQAIDAQMNLLRVWGGGIYETEEFYDLCDEMGVLVWQDFPFACAAYHEGSPIREEVVAEAQDNVIRLMPHPSLAIYNGSNENIWGVCDWGWLEVIGGDGSWGLKYYEEILPGIVSALDPSRVYIPSSPFSPHHPHMVVHPNDPAWGPSHEWEVWNRVDYAHYRDKVPRFCAEFGFQGPATWATLVRTLSAEAFDQNHPAWLLHQKADDGNDKLNRGFAPHLPACDDFETWHWTTSLNQARAIQFAIEHYRSWWPVCSGAIVWQLNDCWPVTSWAAIDFDERKKPLWYALKHAYAPRLLTFQPRGDKNKHDPQSDMHLVLVNDSAQSWSSTLTFKRVSLDGTICAVHSVPFTVEARRAETIDVPLSLRSAGDPSREVLVAESGRYGEIEHARAMLTFVEDRDLAYQEAPFAASAERVPGGYAITVKADGVVRDLTLLVDKVVPSAEVDDALVTLLPGEVHVFHVKSEVEVAPAAFLTQRVLVSVNSLVGRANFELVHQETS